ncbi:MAG: tripartite tricarboxylate transporter TctB family protein [Angelakisella sp.]
MKLNAKKIVLLGLTLLGLYWIVGSLQLELWVRRGPGGGFMPLLAGILCVLFCLMILAKEWKSECSEHFDKKALIPILALLTTVLASYLVGVAIALVIFVFLWLFLFEKFPLKNCVLVAVIWPGILYAVFVLWLQAPLPKGLLGLL